MISKNQSEQQKCKVHPCDLCRVNHWMSTNPIQKRLIVRIQQWQVLGFLRFRNFIASIHRSVCEWLFVYLDVPDSLTSFSYRTARNTENEVQEFHRQGIVRIQNICGILFQLQQAERVVMEHLMELISDEHIRYMYRILHSELCNK